jgi:hypothetical protein
VLCLSVCLTVYVSVSASASASASASVSVSVSVSVSFCVDNTRITKAGLGNWSSGRSTKDEVTGCLRVGGGGKEGEWGGCPWKW